MTTHNLALNVNGRLYAAEVEPRLLLSDFIREHAGLRGTRVGCEHGVCGSCTVQLEGRPIRSCLMFAVQAQGKSVRTVEDLASDRDSLHPLQRAFHEAYALQCGFCTAGLLMSAEPLLREKDKHLTDDEIREAIAGNICRCTGYQNIIVAIRRWLEGEFSAGAEK
jgi:carbon-monoxide dehydrogenase small subunit/2-furoyl-CoA dehydrogenase 2Fe-2S iron sulfur subunit